MKPTKVKVLKTSRALELCYEAESYKLSFEFLRVFSPSAEVRGHGTGSAVLQTGKKAVGLLKVEPVGNYALKLVFDDGHDSGLYDWRYLKHLCNQKEALWSEYLEQLAAAGASRESQLINFRAL